MNKPVKPRWYRGQDIVTMLGIKGFELFDLMKNGLQAYTNTGKKVVDSDSLPRAKRDSLEKIEANQRAKANASVMSSSGSWHHKRSDGEIKHIALSIYNAQSLEILNPPKDCVLMSFTLPNDNEKALLAISRALFFQFKSVDVVKSINEYNQSHPLLSEETQNETVEHQKQPKQDFNEEADSESTSNQKEKIAPKGNISRYMSKKGKKGGEKPKMNQPMLLAITQYLREHPKLENTSNKRISNSFKRDVTKDEPMTVSFKECEWDVYYYEDYNDAYITAIPDTKNTTKYREASRKISTVINSYIPEAKNIIKKTQK